MILEPGVYVKNCKMYFRGIRKCLGHDFQHLSEISHRELGVL